MATGKHLHKFLSENMSRYGITLLAAANLPGARAAEQRDMDDAGQQDSQRTTGEWLKSYDGKGFRSIEDRELAFADPAYKTSPAYREAVARMAMDTPDLLMGVQRPHANVPTSEQMIFQARMDLFKASKDQLFTKAASKDPVVAAQARLDLVQFHTQPENMALEAELDRTDRAAKPIEYALREAQARGERVGTPLVASHEQCQSVEAHPYDAFAVDAAPKGEPGSEWR